MSNQEDTIYNAMQRMRDRAASEQTLDGEKYSHSSKGNEWLVMIRCEGMGGALTSCNEARYGSDHTLLFDHMFDVSRRTNANIVGMNKFDTARPRFSNPLIKIPTDVWTPTLENILVAGTLIDEINLKRLSNTGDVNVLVQEIKFEKNILQALVQDGDYVWLEFRTQIYTNTVFRRKQDTTAAGSNSFTYDIAQATVTSGASDSSAGGE